MHIPKPLGKLFLSLAGGGKGLTVFAVCAENSYIRVWNLSHTHYKTMNIEVKDDSKSNVLVNAEVTQSQNTLYSDGDIAMIYDFRGLSHDGLISIKADMFMLITCLGGTWQFDVGSKRVTIGERDAFIYVPQTVLSACVFSPGFKVSVLCLSTKIMTRFMGESKLWEKAFKISENPVIRFSEDNVALFTCYADLIGARFKATERGYRKEVMSAITCAAIYELMAEIDKRFSDAPQPMITSGERLFQRFIILLSDQEVKPRSVSWYADKLCVTTKYLSSVCKSISKHTARDIISYYVVADIQRLLKYSNLSTKEIAVKLDFPNISFFGKYVKAHLGLSPNEYRKRTRRGEL